jgi:hypothetical protein
MMAAMEQRSPAGTTQLSGRRRRGTVSPVKAVKAQPAKRKTSATLENLLKGQVWKVKDTYVQIVDAGKTLIHYTMSPKPRQRGLRVHMATRSTVQDFLKSNQARLVGR